MIDFAAALVMLLAAAGLIRVFRNQRAEIARLETERDEARGERDEAVALYFEANLKNVGLTFELDESHARVNQLLEERREWFAEVHAVAMRRAN